MCLLAVMLSGAPQPIAEETLKGKLWPVQKLLSSFFRFCHRGAQRLYRAVAILKTNYYYRFLFKSIGRNSRIDHPYLLTNPHFVEIANRTFIRAGARIEAIVVDGPSPPSLLIGSNVNIEQNVHIVCSSRIVIGDNVSITGNCAIVDTVHPFDDVLDQRKVGERIDPQPRPVSIGSHTFVGFGSVILPGVSIGKYCVIGANSTVTRSFPDYCVIAGNPACVLRHYDLKQNTWLPGAPE